MRARQIEDAPGIGDKPLETLVLFTPIVEIARRDRAMVEAARQGTSLPDHHQPLLIREIEGAQNHSVRQAEDRRVRRDPTASLMTATRANPGFFINIRRP